MLAAIAAALRAAASAAATGLRWCWWSIEWVASVPGRLVRGMVPSGAGSVPLPPEAPRSEAGDALAEVQSLVASASQRRAALAKALPQDLAPRADGTSPLGDLVHRYAAASSDDRRRMPLDALSPEQAAWLLRLRPDQLERLALAGPRACDRLLEGRRAGVVGIEPCRRRDVDAPDVVEAEVEERPAPRLDLSPGAVTDRLRRRRGLTRAA